MTAPTLDHRLALQGEWTVARYDRATGALIEETGPQPNAITTSGKHLLLRSIRGDYATGVDSAARPLGASTAVHILDAGFNTLRRLGSAAPGWTNPTFTGTTIAKWKWRDDSQAAYTPGYFRVRNWDSDFSYYDFSLAQVNFGAKPSHEIWEYTYQVSLASSGSTLTSNGLGMVLGLLCGTETRAFTQDATYLDGYSGTAFNPTYVNQWVPCTGTTLDQSASTMTWSFLVPENTPGEWHATRVYRIVPFGSFNESSKLALRDGADTARTKLANQRWHFHWTLAF
jgi:hypothetical protein